MSFAVNIKEDFDKVVYGNRRFVIIEKMSEKSTEKRREKYRKEIVKSLNVIINSKILKSEKNNIN